MRTLIIDRLEGEFAICEEQENGKSPKAKHKDLHFFGIAIAELPEGAKEGSVLHIDADGNLTLDAAATEARRKKILELQNALWAD